MSEQMKKDLNVLQAVEDMLGTASGLLDAVGEMDGAAQEIDEIRYFIRGVIHGLNVSGQYREEEQDG